MPTRLLLLACLAACAVLGQAGATIATSVQRLEQLASNEPFELGTDTRLQAAAALLAVDPAKAHALIVAVAAQLTAPDRKPAQAPPLLREIAALDKTTAFQVLQHLPFDETAQDPWPLLDSLVAIRTTLPEGSLLAAIRLLAAHSRDAELRTAIDALNADDFPKQLGPILAARSPTRAATQQTMKTFTPRLKELRGNLTVADRAHLAQALASEIRALPAGAPKLTAASALSNLATEGDLGTVALQEVTTTLALAIREAVPAVTGDHFLELAKLVRYEHMQAPYRDDSLDARLELLHLRDLTVEHTPLSLTGIDGKTYSLQALRGKVVIVNFWATWCPPCRKEMPDLEALSRSFKKKGLVVLAISDEPAETVKPFIAKQQYTFPVLLDPDRKVNDAFHIEGIPKTFVFDRDGRLAAQSIDMRTKDQFLALLQQAGLQ